MASYECGDGRSAIQCVGGELSPGVVYPNVGECCKGCGMVPDCSWFVYDSSNGNCTLHSSCDDVVSNSTKSIYSVVREIAPDDDGLSDMWIVVIVISIVLLLVVVSILYWKRDWLCESLCGQQNTSPSGIRTRNGPNDTEEEEDDDYEMKKDFKVFDNCSTPTPPDLRALPSQSPPYSIDSQEYKEWDLFNRGLRNSRHGNIFAASQMFNEARGVAPDDQLGETLALSKAMQFGYSFSVAKSLLESQKMQQIRHQNGWPLDWGYSSHNISFPNEKLPKNNCYSLLPSPDVTADNFTDDSNNGDMEAIDASSVVVDSVC
eukprot:TRINITY_DN2423_c0_g2_i1.p1 TRINITY_DN2423_c0_g2~~TRINITY_DN2423_c0_g2_i1.p1  ORF type:complete len:318 (+),score=51.71 TRINITY_DN2423_c0_g2_i1:148-1101(+)